MITMSHFRRPEYSQRSCASLARCEGIERHEIRVGIDRSFRSGRVEQVVRETLPGAIIHHHELPVGCSANVLGTVRDGFTAGADLVLHIEDDLVVSPDAITLTEWCHHQFGNDPSVFCCSLWGTENWPEETYSPDSVIKQPFFGCWGWSISRRSWFENVEPFIDQQKFMEPYWYVWDAFMDRCRGARCCVAPLYSRTNNIGDEGGFHRGGCTPRFLAEGTGYSYRCLN